MQDFSKLEKDLWEAADQLRANANLPSNEYFMPILGVIFLRHAANRFDAVTKQIVADQAAGRMPKRKAKQADYVRRRALWLPEEARFDSIMKLPTDADWGQALIDAMNAIEKDFDPLKGVLPKDYSRFDKHFLEELLRIFNRETLRSASGDVFGLIYEFFLMKFADQKAHDDGEFFTPPSLVQTIVNVIEPEHGTVFDPACGSGGMFVQSSHFIEDHGLDTAKRVVFYGHEKTATTIKLAKMNLAVHGLEGDIREANTFYQDEHTLFNKCDFVMANPPFNVDMVDAEKIEGDRRLPFGLPGVNKQKKVSNGNYLWISYFWSYLNNKGRAGFVMSSQASSAGHREKDVRRKIVETGDVDVMISIRSNFFYTRSVPCELWFFDRGRPEKTRNRVLMIDARSIYRKVTRKIFDFSPEQLANLSAIVWLYRGETKRFLGLLSEYLGKVVDEAQACFESEKEDVEPIRSLPEYAESLAALRSVVDPFLKTQPKKGFHAEALVEFDKERKLFAQDVEQFRGDVTKAAAQWEKAPDNNAGLNKLVKQLAPLAESSRDLIKQMDLLCKLASRLIETCENECHAKVSDAWKGRDVSRALKGADEARQQAVEQLKQVRYSWRQAHWLTERFPEGRLCNVAELVKLVDRAEIEANDWSLTPGRYVDIVPEEKDEDFDFEETLRDMHVELEDLNSEAVRLAATIKKNFEELGV